MAHRDKRAHIWGSEGPQGPHGAGRQLCGVAGVVHCILGMGPRSVMQPHDMVGWLALHWGGGEGYAEW